MSRYRPRSPFIDLSALDPNKQLRGVFAQVNASEEAVRHAAEPIDLSVVDPVLERVSDDRRLPSPPRRAWFMLPDASAGACAFQSIEHCTQRARYPEASPQWCEVCWFFRKTKIQTVLEDEKRARRRSLAEVRAATIPPARGDVPATTTGAATTERASGTTTRESCEHDPNFDRAQRLNELNARAEAHRAWAATHLAQAEAELTREAAMQPLRLLIDVPMARLAEILGEELCNLVVDTPEQRLHPNVRTEEYQTPSDRWIVKAFDPWDSDPPKLVANAELIRWDDNRTEVVLEGLPIVTDASASAVLDNVRRRVGASRVELITTAAPHDDEAGMVTRSTFTVYDPPHIIVDHLRRRLGGRPWWDGECFFTFSVGVLAGGIEITAVIGSRDSSGLHILPETARGLRLAFLRIYQLEHGWRIDLDPSPATFPPPVQAALDWLRGKYTPPTTGADRTADALALPPTDAATIGRRRDNGLTSYATLEDLKSRIAETLDSTKTYVLTAEHTAEWIGLTRPALYKRLESFGSSWPELKTWLQARYPQLRRRR